MKVEPFSTSSRFHTSALFLFLLLFGCRGEEKAVQKGEETYEWEKPQFLEETVEITFEGGFSVTAELADEELEKVKGLMFRETLEPSKGMFFIYEEEGIYPIWMKNTLIPLDLIWMRGEGGGRATVVHIEKHVPPCRNDPCPSYVPFATARYILEVRAGVVDHEGLKKGEGAEITGAPPFEKRKRDRRGADLVE